MSDPAVKTAASTTPGAGTIAVIGAGIVGLACAVLLQRELGGVTVLDALPPGGGASFGNSGLIAVDSCGPMATPGLLRQAPRWLMDPDGPLAIRRDYVLRALPWLVGRLRASRMDRVVAASDAFRALHKPALEIYRDLLGPSRFSDLIRMAGHIEVWEGEQESESQKIGRELRARHGIRSEPLDRQQLRQFVPQISDHIRRAEFVPNGAHTVNPQRLTATLGELLQEAGGKLAHERVMRILPEAGAGFRLVTNVANRRFSKVLIAGGAWSNRLIEPLGVSLPLEAERGYHVMVHGAALDLRLPILHRSRGFGATPMEGGVRFAGTVEIAGLDAPFNERRAEAIRRQAERLFPSLETAGSSIWMGHRPCFPDNVPVLDGIAGFPGLFIACGHGHFGITSAPASARAMLRMIAGRAPEIALAPYRADRFR